MAAYEQKENKTFKITDDGERFQLANFIATIDREIRYVDGRSEEVQLEISGIKHDGTKLPSITIASEDFAGLTWTMKRWGPTIIISPGASVKEDLRTAIQLYSKPELKTIYKHTGWTMHNGKPTYLHARGGITTEGNDPNITVTLPSELARYSMPDPHTDYASLTTDIKTTLELTRLAPPHVAWPLFAATLAPTITPVDFAIHLTGRTGTFKSELTSLFQSFYGPDFTARHLPGSWSSTPNALEAQAFLAKNAAFVLDDFVPAGTSWQIRAYQTTADKIIRSQGNQAGRARLTDTSRLQSTMYPRGIILSTGEDTPEGHSIRARMLILELSPGDIDPANLTKAQANRPAYSRTTATWIKNIATNMPDINPLIQSYRDANQALGHTRTPSMTAILLATCDTFLNWCLATKAINSKKAAEMQSEAHATIKQAAANQVQYLATSDPVECFMSALRNLLAQNNAHIRTVNGGIPNKPTTLGWTQEQSDADDLPAYRSHGPCIGWIHWATEELFLEMNAGLPAVRKAAGSEVPLTKGTLLKRLHDSGAFKRIDEARGRNAIRITAERHPRTVLALDTRMVFPDEIEAEPEIPLFNDGPNDVHGEQK
jgi:hypothetical protein